MKRLLEELFHIPKNGKVPEKAMLTRLVTSVILILACMAAMSITAYAYFSSSITTNVSPVQSALWRITVEPEQDVVLDGSFYVMDNSAGSEERCYRFALTKANNATASHGYVKIEVKTDVDDYEAEQTYYSQPLGRFLVDGSMTEDLDRDVKITVPAGKIAYVQFTAEWGSCAKQPVIEEGAGILPQYAAGVEITPEDTDPEPTNPETTEGTTEPETTEEETEPETTEEATETETTEEPTEPVTTEAPTEPETTEEPTEAETSELETTEVAMIQETTVPETTQ